MVIRQLRRLLPLNKEQKKIIETIKEELTEEEEKNIKNLLKENRIGGKIEEVNTSITTPFKYATLRSYYKEPNVTSYLKDINEKVKKQKYEKAFKEFSKKAYETIKELIAPQILGLENIKEATTLMLFSKEPIHILLMGDPGTGKTEILRSIEELAPKSTFGLGSGTSSVGLSVTIKGNEIKKGLLPMADEGICCIDELNLMKHKDMAALYNAMEKGFVTYTKGGKNIRVNARVKVLATANPKGDYFAGKSTEIIKQQLPFNPALLTRFHLIFLIRKPTRNEFKEIAKHVMNNNIKIIKKTDLKFIHEYITYAQNKEVKIQKETENEIIKFIDELNKDEKKFLTPITPRIILGTLRLAKAHAKANLQEKITEKNIRKATTIVKKAMYQHH